MTDPIDPFVAWNSIVDELNAFLRALPTWSQSLSSAENTRIQQENRLIGSEIVTNASAIICRKLAEQGLTHQDVFNKFIKEDCDLQQPWQDFYPKIEPSVNKPRKNKIVRCGPKVFYVSLNIEPGRRYRRLFLVEVLSDTFFLYSKEIGGEANSSRWWRLLDKCTEKLLAEFNAWPIGTDTKDTVMSTLRSSYIKQYGSYDKIKKVFEPYPEVLERVSHLS